MKIDKFIDSWFTGRCLKHPVVVAVIFYLIGYAVGTSMKREDIIRMAREAGFTELEFYGNKLGTNPTECLEAFAALVAAAATEAANARANTSWSLMCKKMVSAENEACAKVCDARAIEYDGFSAEQNASEKLAAAIRARGQA
jgi:hypothetical protein